ncbi:MAG: AraC family transcriptional regulator [Deltaproteobacteria bacterium]|nr:MAG: AraC family transcriptional regulator [Deltaproteobacteria bacterium]
MRDEYISRINRVIDYVDANIGDDFSLKTLSEVACFSQYHFHRIFKAISGETVHQFTQRLRVEKAAAQLVNWPEKSITDIALHCGFSSSAAFARTFRGTFQMSPSQWRSKHLLEKSKNCKTKSKKWKDFDISSYYIDSVSNNLTWKIQIKNKKPVAVEVKYMPEPYVAYIRRIGPYKGDSELFETLFTRLMNWAGARRLLQFPETVVMSVYHDSPQITEEDKLRTSVCITVPAETPVAGEIGKMKLPGGEFAVAGFELSGSEEYEEAWNFIFRNWLPESGYQPDDRLCYEIYRNSPKEHPEGIHIVDICIPIKPL